MHYFDLTEAANNQRQETKQHNKMMQMDNVFLSCDWGTSSFRLRLIDATNSKILSVSSSGEGVSGIYGKWQQRKGDEQDRIDFYRSVLQTHIQHIEQDLNVSLNHVPIVVSGMASSTIGMKELPYRHFPFSVLDMDLYREEIKGTDKFLHEITLISGARTHNDVMRGEETQLAGCYVDKQDATQLFIFPGTHSKHIFVENGVATDFQTFMTGEFFQLLSVNSILSNSVAPGGSLQDADNRSAFETGVRNSGQKNLLHHSFMVRTNELFQYFSKEANYWYLSGLLIGAELNNLAQKPIGKIILVSQGTIAVSYKIALQVLGMHPKVSIADVDEALINAHILIFTRKQSNLAG